VEEQYESRWRRFIIFQFPLLAVMIFALFPLAWMVVASFKGDRELYDPNLSPYIVREPTLSHYRFLFENTLYTTWLFNSTLVTAVAVSFSLLASVMAAYALSRLKFPGVRTLGWMMFVTYLVPATLLFLPMTRVMINFGLINSRFALMATYPTFLIPFCTWYLMAYFRSIPVELEEAARLDGASRLATMTRIALPLVAPGVLSVGIFAFTNSWNEYLYALVFISDSSLRTIPVGVTGDLVRGDQFFWGELMAAAVVGSLPVVMLYMIFVNRIIPGLTAGAVRG